MFGAASQAQTFVAETVEASAANAHHVKPLFFIQAEQRSTHESFAEAQSFQQRRYAAEPDLPTALEQGVAV
ncbi:Uncharacterised protein [Klebsiella oxytoca]|nr:Uncharacterised protein [Klebsiella oxytoca]